jgi:hypothetical protein
VIVFFFLLYDIESGSKVHTNSTVYNLCIFNLCVGSLVADKLAFSPFFCQIVLYYGLVWECFLFRLHQREKMQLPDVIEYGGKNSLCSGRTGGIGFLLFALYCIRNP